MLRVSNFLDFEPSLTPESELEEQMVTSRSTKRYAHGLRNISNYPTPQGVRTWHAIGSPKNLDFGGDGGK